MLVKIPLKDTGLLVGINDQCPAYGDGISPDFGVKQQAVLTTDRTHKQCGCIFFEDEANQPVWTRYDSDIGKVSFLCHTNIITIKI